MNRILSLDSVNNKAEIIIDGESVVDMTDQVLDFSQNIELQQRDVIVSSSLAGKAHLASRMIYGSENHLDMLCSYNGISNPLALEEGTVLVVPNLKSIRKSLTDKFKPEGGKRAKELFQSKIGVKDKTRIENVIEVDEIKTPNMVSEGSSPTIAQDGAILLGTDNQGVRCQNALSDNQKLSERIRSAVIQKLKDNSSS